MKNCGLNLCEKQVLQIDANEHKQCLSDHRPIECPNGCGFPLKALELQPHIDNDCPMVEVPCPYSHLGCAEKVHRRNMEEHIKDANHLKLALDKITDQAQQITDLAQQITDLAQRVESQERKTARKEHLFDRQVKWIPNYTRDARWNNYTGQMKETENGVFVPHGYGTSTGLINESMYEGQWVNGQKCGQGYIKWFETGDEYEEYEGEFKDDEKHGQGIYTFGETGMY